VIRPVAADGVAASLADPTPTGLIIATVSRHVGSSVALILILGFLLVVYLLGEQAGREGPTRSKQLQDIVKAEADLKNLKTNLHSSTTSPWLHWLVIVLLVFGVLAALGSGRDNGVQVHRRYR
jgi:hypothetical protein